MATACQDGLVRVLSMKTKEPPVLLRGHTKRVFGVRWNPIYTDILCSGSDDHTVKVCISTQTSSVVATIAKL